MTIGFASAMINSKRRTVFLAAFHVTAMSWMSVLMACTPTSGDEPPKPSTEPPAALPATQVLGDSSDRGDAKPETDADAGRSDRDGKKLATNDKSGMTAKVPAEIVVMTDQRYGEVEGNAGLCDVYLPPGPSPAGGRPVVIVIHGGGWSYGDKWTLQGYSRLLARHGCVAVSINYRLAPRHKFPAQVDDVRAALLWTVANAAKFSIDLGRVGLCGYSAGGHLSTLVASLADEPVKVRATASDWPPQDDRWQKLPAIHAVCAGGPPCDFRNLPPGNTTLAYFLGGARRDLPERYVAASPAAHVSAGDPVTQIIHGDSDLLVPVEGSRKFHRAQKEAGIDSRLVVMPKQGHMVTFLNPETPSRMVAFFEEVFELTGAAGDSTEGSPATTQESTEPKPAIDTDNG